MGVLTNRTAQVVEPVLTNLARQYRPDGLVAEQLAPRIPVAKEAGKYNLWSAHGFFSTADDPLVPDRAETKEIDVDVTQAGYLAEEYALKASISEREARQAANMLRLREAKQNAVLDRLAVHRELRIANLLRATDQGGELDNSMDSIPSNNWNIDAGTIEADIIVAKEAIYDAVGFEANTIVIPVKVATAISVQQDIRDIFKYTVDGRQLLGAGSNILPPEIWGLRVLIPRGRRITSGEAATSDTYSDIWGDDVRVLYVDPSPSTEKLSVAYTFEARGRETRTWRTNDPNVEYIRSSDGIYDEKVVTPFGGFVIRDVLS